MKKFLTFAVLLFLARIGLAMPSPRSKVVELHITKHAISEKEAARRLELKVSDRHYVCSGGFIDPYGDIITAKHCVEGADEIEVVTSDNQHFDAIIAKVSKNQDLAGLHIDTIGNDYFVMASSTSRGDQVSTLGSPLAITDTQSYGTIAKIDGDIFFLDQSVLPGNSGGILFNNDGEMVGIVTAVAVVGFGVTHLGICQSLQSIFWFFKRP